MQDVSDVWPQVCNRYYILQQLARTWEGPRADPLRFSAEAGIDLTSGSNKCSPGSCGCLMEARATPGRTYLYLRPERGSLRRRHLLSSLCCSTNCTCRYYL